MHLVVHHKLIEADANARTAAAQGLDATVALAELAPFAAMAGLDVQGGLKLGLHAAVAGDATTIGVDSTVGVTGGMQQIRDLVGDAGHLTLDATLHGRDVTLSRLQLDGRSLTASASGSVAQDQVDLTWTLGVSDLAAAEPTLAGQLQATGNCPRDEEPGRPDRRRRGSRHVVRHACLADRGTRPAAQHERAHHRTRLAAGRAARSCRRAEAAT